MKLTREEAIRLHREMWSDMQAQLGNNPSMFDRMDFKARWCIKHFPTVEILNACFLCEYLARNSDGCCEHCLIEWPDGRCTSIYLTAPISEILALPERMVCDERQDQATSD